MTAAIQKPSAAKSKKGSQPKAEVPPLEVVVVTHFFGGHGGGIEMVAEKLVREIPLQSFVHFTWMASDCDPAPQIEGQTLVPMKSWNGIEKLLGLPWPLWSFKSLKTLKEAIKKADILWLHDTLYPGNILAYRYARKFKKPIAITQHIAPIPYKNPVLRLAMKWADRIFTSRMLLNADEVIFISDRVAEEYYARVPFTRPIRVIPNGVDVRLYHAPIPENRRYLRQQFALKNDQPVILFVGRFVAKKGLDVIRRLATALPEWRFWLAGGGPIDPDEWLLPNVHVFSGRKGQALAELYQAADLLMMPSYGEGFPLVVQEAMACGLPVLCGPSTAEGSRVAVPYLHIAEVWPDNPERTAAVWLEKLKAFPVTLPLAKPIEEVAEFALASWDWPPIARVYAQVLTGLKREKA